MSHEPAIAEPAATSAADWRKQRARKRTVQRAIELFDANTRGFRRRAWAHQCIASAKVPGHEANRLIAWVASRDVTGTADDADEPDYSDTQELRVRILRRDGVLDTPQAMLLARMDRIIAAGDMDRATFTKLAATAWRMPSAWPKQRPETRQTTPNKDASGKPQKTSPRNPLQGHPATTLAECPETPLAGQENQCLADALPQGSDQHKAA